MKLSELVKAVGDENIKVQNLADAVTNISVNKKGISTVTFKTDGMKPEDILFTSNNANLCLLIIVPKSKIPQSALKI